MLRVILTITLTFVLGVYLHALCVEAEVLTKEEASSGLWISLSYALLIGLMVKEERG
ncbi:MAG: hypothetical protein AB8B50_04015 [Pirellulaceae bacterium]